MQRFQEKLKDHFLNPRNSGVLADPTTAGEAGSVSTGAAVRLQLKVDPANVVSDVRFQAYGDPATVAAASALTELVKGKDLAAARAVSLQVLSTALGGVPEQQGHSLVTALDALDAALAGLNGRAAEDSDDEYNICRCFSVGEARIERAIRDHKLTDVDGITRTTKAGGGCGSCRVDLGIILERVTKEIDEADKKKTTVKVRTPPPETAGLPQLAKMQLIQEVLDREVRPGLAMDGGDMELVDVKDNKVFVELHGHCVSCSSSNTTMKFFVEDKLRELVDPAITVIDVTEHSDMLHSPPMR